MHTTDGGTAVGEELLIALGRQPHGGPGLEWSASSPARRRRRRAHAVPGHDWLYALGDINGKALFTHMGKYQARIAADHLLGHDARAPARRRRHAVAARDLHRAAGRRRRPHDRERRGGGPDRRVLDLHVGQRRRLVLRPQRARHDALDRRPRAPDLVGCTITGAEVADFLHAATIAIVGEVPLERLRHAIPSFPTRSEIWLSSERKPKRSNRRGGSRLRSLRSTPSFMRRHFASGGGPFTSSPRSLRLNLRV